MSASSRLHGLAKKNGNSPRGKKRQKPFALAISQQHTVQKIVWPVELTRHKTARRTITIPQAAFEDLPPLFALPLDIRCGEAATHILSISIASRHTNSSTAAIFAKQEVLRDEHSLIYQEVAHFLYSQTTFTFASFGELGAFLDWISPEAARSIRSVTFIAHMLPDGTEHCKELIEGNYFRGTAGRDHVALFRRIPNLVKLDINFFPSAMLTFTTKFAEMMAPLEDLPRTVAIQVILPRIYYKKERSGEGLPFVGSLGGKATSYTLVRSTTCTAAEAAGCEAYRKFF
ncbi:hypothetical protein C7999DRAFT_44742 [Corynascus novoguineensis]|uniref:Uncharacterized protein n=1 Tax=Corynascus novoguineensis TaxID=1126955 RepID=A0AAN7HB91_9PEZI|nr:hypothetical protein C7999DRAFT_44742 [Corynascus novoguineensis]